MEDSRNDRAVEKRLANAVKNDRARIQIGKISQFGLLEMSRQRLRAGVIAGSTVPCPHCDGQGIIRSVESTALRLLRALEEEGQKQKARALAVKAPQDVTIYALNQKRAELARIETEYGVTVSFSPDVQVHAGHFEIERIGQKSQEERRLPVSIEAGFTDAPEEIADEAGTPAEEAEETEDEKTEQEAGDEGNGRRRRRRRRRGGRDRERPQTMQEPVPSHSIELAGLPSDEEENGETLAADEAHDQDGDGQNKRRRRRRRRRRGRHGETNGESNGVSQAHSDSEPGEAGGEGEANEAPGDMSPGPNTSSEPVWSLTAEPAAPPAHAPQEDHAEPPAPAHEAHAQQNATDRTGSPDRDDATGSDDAAPNDAAGTEANAPPRKGWWQRRFTAKE
jgi:ribonuclease E